MASKAFGLLSSAITYGGQIIATVFTTIFSWVGVVAGSIYILRVAWENNWFGIKDTVLGAWNAMRDGWNGAYKNLKDVWSDENLSFFGKIMGSLGVIAKDTFDGWKAGWEGAYNNFKEIWNDENLSFFEKVGATLSTTISDSVEGWKAGWSGAYDDFASIWSDEKLTFFGSLMATLSKAVSDSVEGWQAGWEGAHTNFKSVWSDESTSFFGKIFESFSLTVKTLWEGQENIPGLKTVFKDAFDNLKATWSNPDLTFWNKVWDTLKLAPQLLLDSIKAVGANITELAGGDSQKYLDTIDTTLASIKQNVKALQEDDGVEKKISVGFDLAKDIYELPAKLTISGIVNNFDQAWIDNAINILGAIGITRFVGGSFRMAVGIALLADFFLGDDWSENKWVNALIKTGKPLELHSCSLNPES